MAVNPKSLTKRPRDRDWIVQASAHGWCLEGDWPYSQKQVVIDTLRQLLRDKGITLSEEDIAWGLHVRDKSLVDVHADIQREQAADWKESRQLKRTRRGLEPLSQADLDRGYGDYVLKAREASLVSGIKTFVAYKAPDPDRFDPLKEPFWTLPMALTWIIWRSSDWVRTQWKEYDAQLVEINRYTDRSRIDSGLVDLSDIAFWTTDDCVPQNFVQNGPAAKGDLRQQLQSGELVATGIPAGASKRRNVTTSEWYDIDLFNPGWPVDSIGEGRHGKLRFNKVVVPSKDVVRIWSASSSSNDPGNAPMITAAHQDNAPLSQADVYRAWIAENESKRKKPTRGECLAHMRKTFPDIDDSSVRALRKERAPLSWTRPGRPKGQQICIMAICEMQTGPRFPI